MNFPPLFLLIGLAAGQLVTAQPGADTARQVRFLPLGEIPPFRQEIRDGIRYELEPPAGSIPPREVSLGFGTEAAEALPLRLGEISAPLKAPAGAGPLLLTRQNAAMNAEPWLRVTRPQTGDFLVLLWRDSKKGTWESARSLVVPDDAASAPAGSVRFINVSPANVGVTLGTEKLLLQAGKTFTRQVRVGAEAPFEVMLPDKAGAAKRLHGGVVLQNPGERTLVLVYQSDGVARRLPLKVVVKREPAPVPPKKE
jgi:hypothetical protein